MLSLWLLRITTLLNGVFSLLRCVEISLSIGIPRAASSWTSGRLTFFSRSRPVISVAGVWREFQRVAALSAKICAGVSGANLTNGSLQPAAHYRGAAFPLALDLSHRLESDRLLWTRLSRTDAGRTRTTVTLAAGLLIGPA